MTLGPLLDHTAAKHDILRFHLQAWFPILGQAFRRSSLQYIDGFCGPGEYQGGEDGSPLLALQEIRAHAYLEDFIEAHRRLKFLFIDKDSDAIDNLNRKISAGSWPKAFDIQVKRGLFALELGKILDEVDRGEREMPPSLILIDPFGPSGFPLDLLKRLAAHHQMDVLINLNYSEFNRWILPNQALHSVADELYGGSRWRPSLDLSEIDRPEFLVRQYEDTLREIGWRGTNFKMINASNQTQYYLVFGTEHIFVGYDHVAFLLALVLWARRIWTVVKVVTAFTLSHSVTLSLAALDLVSLPGGLVEPLIAASVIAVALENFFNRNVARRWWVALFLGLIHGFGFAGVLREGGLPQEGLLVPLAFFNIGVEIGQLAIIAIVVPVLLLIDLLMAPAPAVPVRRPALVYTGSALIAGLGGYWLIERTLLA